MLTSTNKRAWLCAFLVVSFCIPLRNLTAMDSAALGLQVVLTCAGYDPGAIDGMMGEKTMTALEKAKKDFNVPSDGTFSKDDLKKLIARQEDFVDSPIAHFVKIDFKHCMVHCLFDKSDDLVSTLICAHLDRLPSNDEIIEAKSLGCEYFTIDADSLMVCPMTRLSGR